MGASRGRLARQIVTECLLLGGLSAALGALLTLAASGLLTRLAGDALRANPRRTAINVMALLLPVSILIMITFTFDAGGAEIGRLARAIVATPLNVDADSYVVLFPPDRKYFDVS